MAHSGEYYRKAAQLAPQRGDVLNNYGAWLCANGYPAEALVWFERAMADPAYGEQPGTLANSGGCALQAGQRDRADHDLRRALELGSKQCLRIGINGAKRIRQASLF